MSHRRNLVSRQQRDEQSSPAPRNGRPSVARRQPAVLPPYQAPKLPLTLKARQALSELPTNAENKKFEKHIKLATKNITQFAGDVNDRWSASQADAAKHAAKRLESGSDGERNEREIFAEERARKVDGEVERLTREAERALRELIDFEMEIAGQEALLEGVVHEAIVAANKADEAARVRAEAMEARRVGRRREGEEDGFANEDGNNEVVSGVQDEEMPPLPEMSFLSPTELLKKAKADYTAEYLSKDMRTRYASQNSYKSFKTIIHDARNPGEGAPPLSHPSTWFSAESSTSNPAAARRRRMASKSVAPENSDDDDIKFTGAVSSLKCPLTLQIFTEPYSNSKCNHTFEKLAILEFHAANATAFVEPSQGRRGRGVPQGPKLLKCPERGCEAMLALTDFFDDQIIARQVKRQADAAMQDALDEEMEGATADDSLASVQQSKVSKSVGRGKRGHGEVMKVKSERFSGGLGRSALGQEEEEDDDDEMEEDEDEDDDPEAIDMDDEMEDEEDDPEPIEMED